MQREKSLAGIFILSDNSLNSRELPVAFYGDCARDILRVLWFSDNIRIIFQNFNNYLCALECLFTTNKNRRKPNKLEVLIWHGDVKSVRADFF